MKVKILFWNVRGVNDSDKRKVIRNFIRAQRVDLVCLQETKVQEMNKALVRSLGVGRFLDWKALNVEWTAGGILLLWDKRRIGLVNLVTRSFLVLCLFRMVEDGYQWAFSGCMVMSRGVSRNFFGKSWVRSKACGKICGV